MLDLDSPYWRDLTHAYGSAEDMPEMIRRMQEEWAADVPDGVGEEEAVALFSGWFDLASSICPMGEVFSASYAAVPHIVAFAANQPVAERAQLLQLVARVEAGRHRPSAPEVPDSLRLAYRAALSRVPHLVAARVGEPWDPTTAQALAGILLVAKGHPQLGMAVIELSEEVECPQCEATIPLPGWNVEADDP